MTLADLRHPLEDEIQQLIQVLQEPAHVSPWHPPEISAPDSSAPCEIQVPIVFNGAPLVVGQDFFAYSLDYKRLAKDLEKAAMESGCLLAIAPGSRKCGKKIQEALDGLGVPGFGSAASATGCPNRPNTTEERPNRIYKLAGPRLQRIAVLLGFCSRCHSI
eukprot:TRINITY_DN8008_c0_g1_i2.p1 TRINITY_DN8008_c0_g1~~TRINITY_DN8008_c0_g1_i2.p1  ORF type:complete len:161 (-),score=23.56 TRINITY_DN8008_c0_g1_i2:366-848(-)